MENKNLTTNLNEILDYNSVVFDKVLNETDNPSVLTINEVTSDNDVSVSLTNDSFKVGLTLNTDDPKSSSTLSFTKSITF